MLSDVDALGPYPALLIALATGMCVAGHEKAVRVTGELRGVKVVHTCFRIRAGRILLWLVFACVWLKIILYTSSGTISN